MPAGRSRASLAWHGGSITVTEGDHGSACFHETCER